MDEKTITARVGAQLKSLRTLRGISQLKLAEALEVTFQQVQKYENGTNRLTATKLYRAAHFLNAPPSAFFETLPASTTTQTPANPLSLTPEEIRFLKMIRPLDPAQDYPILHTTLSALTAALMENRKKSA